MAELRNLRWICRTGRKDRIRNEYVRRNTCVAPRKDKTKECSFRWFQSINISEAATADIGLFPNSKK